MKRTQLDSRDKAIWSVYIRTNKINGKKYIGLSNDPVRRWANGKGYKGQPFGEVIEKYGAENFEHEIAQDGLTRTEACKLEQELIALYQTHLTQYGYNITKGGEDIRPVYQFDALGNFIKEYPTIIDAVEELEIPSSNIIFACTHKDRTVNKCIWRYKDEVSNPYQFKELFEKEYGFIHDRYYPIYEFDMDSNYIASYDCADDAVKSNPERPLYSCVILDCCRGIYNCSENSIWRFQKDVLDPMNYSHIFKKRKPVINESNIVWEFDLEGHFIAEYESAAEASRVKGCECHTIAHACRTENCLSQGSLWKYKIDCIDKKISPYIPYKVPNMRKVIQYTLDLLKIKEYESIEEAARRTGINRGCIRDTCRGKQKTAGGYKWKYVEDAVG